LPPPEQVAALPGDVGRSLRRSASPCRPGQVRAEKQAEKVEIDMSPGKEAIHGEPADAGIATRMPGVPTVSGEHGCNTRRARLGRWRYAWLSSSTRSLGVRLWIAPKCRTTRLASLHPHLGID